MGFASSVREIFKATLLFNEKSARHDPKKYNPTKVGKNKEFGHQADWLLEVIKRDIPDLRLDTAPQWLPTFLRYLTEFGDNRYLTKATYTRGGELHRLDETVWILRRVCQSFDWTPETENLRPKLIGAAMHPSRRKNPALYRPFGAIPGFLERPSRPPSTTRRVRLCCGTTLFLENANGALARIRNTHHSKTLRRPVNGFMTILRLRNRLLSMFACQSQSLCLRRRLKNRRRNRCYQDRRIVNPEGVACGSGAVTGP